MGLDQYLTKRTNVKNWSFDKETKYEVIVKKNGVEVDHIKSDRVEDVVEEVIYWRKSNQIHQWFVDNCQDGEDDCREYYVDKNQLNDLKDICRIIVGYLDTCDKVFDSENKEYYNFKVEDTEYLKELLPTQSGFFFGSTKYDKWYYEDLKRTYMQLESVLEENNTDRVSFYYQSSW